LKSYRLIGIRTQNDEELFATDSESELSAEGAQVVRALSRELTAIGLRIEQTGPAWDGGNAFALRNVEIIAAGFEPGLFEAKMRGGRPHGITVVVRGDGINPRTGRLTARTFPGHRPWVQLEFTEGVARIEGFRAKPGPRLALKGKDPETGKWNDIVVQATGLDEFGVVGRPCKYARVRIVLAENDDGQVELAEFDLLGEHQERGSRG
jgi:hypothetical protein